MPPVALKDRIALLQQQRSNQPSNDAVHAIHIGSGPASGSLKDKIANFERKGAVPVPRGSFGLGAPPVDDGSSKRKGELYGNRVPGLSKPTVDSVLPNARKRTVSTSHLSSLSVSRLDIPPVPEVADNITNGGERSSTPSLGGPRLPSSLVAPSMRRAVSDVLPHNHEPENLVHEAVRDCAYSLLMERETVLEEEGGEQTGVVSLDDNTGAIPSEQPAIVVSPTVSPQTSPVVPNTANTVLSSPSVYSPVSPRDISNPATPYSVSSPATSGDLSPLSSLSPPNVLSGGPQSTSSTVPSSPSSEAVTSLLKTDLHDALAADERNALLPELDAGLALDDTSASSDAVPTPRDDVFDAVSPSIRDPGDHTIEETIAIKTHDVTVVQQSSPVSTRPQLTVVPTSEAADTRRLSGGSSVSVGSITDKSLALDTSEAVIVDDPPRVVSPTRAMLVPAPRPSPSPSPVAVSPTASPWVSDLEEQMSAASSRQSFHTVVHHKVKEIPSRIPVPVAATAPAGPKVISRIKPSTSQARTPSIVRTSVAIEEPLLDSPSIGDLALLLQDAALLEEQLSGPSPSKAKSFHKHLPPAELTITPPPPPSVTPIVSRASTEYNEPTTPRQFDTPARPTSINVDPTEEEETQDSFDVDDLPLARTMLMFPTPRSSSLPYLNPTPPHTPAGLRISDSRLEADQATHASSVPASPASSRSRLESNASQTSSRSRLQSSASQNSSRSRLPSNASQDVPPTPPPKSPTTAIPRYFPNLRMRKPSMPGAFPRSSYSSEDSSLMLPTPPSPTYPHLDSQSERSDTSSIRSSRKSLKSPKRSKSGKSGLGRAGSVVERLWRGGKGKSSPVENDDDSHLSAETSSQRASSPTHLSPYNLPRLPVPQRPTSWVSIETTGSGGDVFDRDLFDSFPSVPESSQSVNAHRQYRSTSSHLGSSEYGHASEMGYTSSLNAPSTLPGARSNAHAKQRSTMF